MAYRPIGPWIEGCVPEWIRYVPGRRLLHVSAGTVPTPLVAPPGTSVANERTRSGWRGGVKTASPAPASVPPNVPGQVVPCGACVGLGVVRRLAGSLGFVPRPPPSWPTITSEVWI